MLALPMASNSVSLLLDSTDPEASPEPAKRHSLSIAACKEGEILKDLLRDVRMKEEYVSYIVV